MKTIPKRKLLIGLIGLGLSISMPAQAQQQLPTVPSQQSGFGSSVQREIESILGEAENDIMQGIQDIITSFINTAISNLLGASPLASVEKLKALLKDAHSKLQKVEYQNYKVEYQEMKANTELTQNFVDYYNNANLKQELVDLARAHSRMNAYVNSPVFTDTERKSLSLALSTVGKTDDIVGDIRTACNQGSGDAAAIWMSTAERVKIIDGAKEEIIMRRKMIKSLTAQLANVYGYRVKEMTQSTASAGWFDKNSVLNRRVNVSEKLYK